MLLPDAAREIQRLMDLADEDGVEALCAALDEAHPRDNDHQRLIASAYSAMGRRAEAIERLRACAGRAGDNPAVWLHLATACRDAGRIEEGFKAAAEGLRFAPDDPNFVAMRGDLLFLAGRFREAYDWLRPHVDAWAPHPLVLLSFGRACGNVEAFDEGAAALARCAAMQGVPPPWRADALFRLGRLRDMRGNFADAFATYVEANRAVGASWDVAWFDREVDALRSAWTPGALRERAAWGDSSERPVFIVGLPRTGTSLVEQIVAMHPDVHGAGELRHLTVAAGRWLGGRAHALALLSDMSVLDEPSAKREAGRYLQHLDRADPAAARVSDKLPHNFLHLGLIQIMFPRARVIHCTRDARDTCLSCFFQNFGGANPYKHNLAHLGAFLRAHDRIMAHWRDVLDLSMLEVPYEALVADQATWSRRMIEFLGVPWNEACLRPHESQRVTLTASSDQVRRPVYDTAIGRWRAYERWLGELFKALEARA